MDPGFGRNSRRRRGLTARARVLARTRFAAQDMLRDRYPPLSAMALEGLPVIAIRIERVASWGDLSVAEDW